MRNAKLVQSQVAPVCQHEMGHFVAARVLGFRVDQVALTMTPNSGHNGRSTIYLQMPGTASIVDVQRYIERRVIVLYAGAMSQSLPPFPKSNREVVDRLVVSLLGDDHQDPDADRSRDLDCAASEELIQIVRNIRFPEGQTDGPIAQSQLQAIGDELSKRGAALGEQLVVLAKPGPSPLKRNDPQPSEIALLEDARSYLEERGAVLYANAFTTDAENAKRIPPRGRNDKAGEDSSAASDRARINELQRLYRLIKLPENAGSIPGIFPPLENGSDSLRDCAKKLVTRYAPAITQLAWNFAGEIKELNREYSIGASRLEKQLEPFLRSR